MRHCANLVPTGQPSLRYGDFSIFQNSRRPPSWICFARAWTTHEVYLVVFIPLQNLIGIGAVVLIINTFLANVNSCSRSLYAIAVPSVVCLS